jgi:predicted metal-dependent HD superfamily phosphohydrolase
MNFTRDRFVALARVLSGDDGVDDVAAGWFVVLDGLYRQSHRHYHGMGHIDNLLTRLDGLRPCSAPFLDRLPEAECAVWFHDAVYAVGSKTNEETSALLARAFLFSIGATDTVGTAGGRPGSVLDTVNGAIMATKHDGKNVENNAARVMVDLDLAGFADPWDEFEENNRRIREEYAAVPEDAYRWGRIAFLASLLGRRIYSVLTELEAPARENIKRHARDLATGGSAR